MRILNGSAGTAAKIRVWIQSTNGHQIWHTVGASTNIIEASRLALEDSLEFALKKTFEVKGWDASS